MGAPRLEGKNDLRGKVEKYDIKKAHKELYAPSARSFSLVQVPPLAYLAIDGHGDPNTAPAYTEALEALYSVAYALKFHGKKELGQDCVVAPLEGLWWAQDMAAFTAREKASWDWTMMIALPGWAPADLVAPMVRQVAGKKDLPGLPRLCVAELDEGLCVQIMHIGPYDAEGPVLERLHHEFMPEHGLHFNGRHHEIYLGDPRRAAPEKLKTILRQPVARGGEPPAGHGQAAG